MAVASAAAGEIGVTAQACVEDGIQYAVPRHFSTGVDREIVHTTVDISMKERKESMESNWILEL
jgi:hypothetical protein